MKVNGFFLVAGAALVLASTAQAQVQPVATIKPVNIANAGNIEIALLKKQIVDMQNDIKAIQNLNVKQGLEIVALKGQLDKVKTELAGKSSINHFHNVNGAISGKGVCGGLTSGAAPC